ncbi:hypothetical protein AVEN_67846-1 [Araneus ventricosus]|uniref:Uncharacterized protein n=1 Tax=Araneus ventricosus TaxID=182803 RepID=A0A4Y2R851_ARAVE|nr:hypothetical protein AVEN_67846-1 [Araneus ventricosus]
MHTIKLVITFLFCDKRLEFQMKRCFPHSTFLFYKPKPYDDFIAGFNVQEYEKCFYRSSIEYSSQKQEETDKVELKEGFGWIITARETGKPTVKEC